MVLCGEKSKTLETDCLALLLEFIVTFLSQLSSLKKEVEQYLPHFENMGVKWRDEYKEQNLSDKKNKLLKEFINYLSIVYIMERWLSG